MSMGWSDGHGAFSTMCLGGVMTLGRARARALPAIACWLAGLACLLFLAACQRGAQAEGTRNLLLGRSTSAAIGVNGANRLTDGVAAFPGEDWDTELSVQFRDEDSFVTYDLGSVVPLRALWFQADHNDNY